MASHWIYLTIGVLVSLIALGIVAINTALEHPAIAEQKLSTVSTIVKLNDSVLTSISSNTRVNLYVIRFIPYDPSQASKLPPADAQALAKYPVLQSAMNEAENRYEAVEHYFRTAGPIPPYGVTIQIPADEARAMISEPSFEFQKDHELYVTSIKLGDAIYGVEIYGL